MYGAYALCGAMFLWHNFHAGDDAIKNLRLYIETTVFNYYFDEDRDGHADTVRLFEAIGAGRFEAYTSKYATEELREAPEPKRSKMLMLADKYSLDIFEIDDESTRLANLYIHEGIIPPKYRADAAHIAIASIHGLDCVVSYNFQHINRLRTKLLTEHVNTREGYNGVFICTAKEALEDEYAPE
jgi:predicted nucleic acid-binding protein